MIDRANLGADNAFEGLQQRTRANRLDKIAPVGSLPQIHGVVIAVGEPESNRHASGRLESERIDQFLAQEPHRRGAEDDDALVVQADDPLIRTKVEHL
jgi:hypothetical protein